MMIPEFYEPYPGCTPGNFSLDFLTRNPIVLEAFCKKERIDPRRLPGLVSEVLTEWELTEATHFSRREALQHMINHIRIKLRNEQRNNQTWQGRSTGRSQHGNTTAYDLARDLLENPPL